jgi:hypothetical protein
MPCCILLTLLFCVSTASKAAITSDGRNVHIATPGRSGSVIVDGSVDIKQMMKNYDILSSVMDSLNTTMLDALALNGEQEVCCSLLRGQRRVGM